MHEKQTPPAESVVERGVLTDVVVPWPRPLSTARPIGGATVAADKLINRPRDDD